MLNKLAELDWNFKNSRNSKNIHSIHPYPAKFIPEIPKQLITNLGLPSGTAILDPFCGSGTTLHVAQSLGIDSVGIDLNPIACLISRVKTRPLPSDFLDIAHRIVSKSHSSDIDLSEIESIPNINHWFKKEVQKEILELKSVIVNGGFSQTTEDALKLALSSILVRVSNQDSDTRYAAVEKNIDINSIKSLFLSSCEKLFNNLCETSFSATVDIVNKNVLEVTKDDINKEIGLVITSPPYPNAYEYWLYHKYRMWWLDFDPILVKSKEIGARAHFFKKNHHTAEDFFHQMKGTLEMIESVLVDGGHSVFLVGRSKIHGEIVDNAQLIMNAAEEIGLEVIGRFNREMKSDRKSFNLSHANIKEETFVIIKKP